jgi:hypothetical protein
MTDDWVSARVRTPSWVVNVLELQVLELPVAIS